LTVIFLDAIVAVMPKQKPPSRPRNAIAVFAKSPSSERVKTRLQNPLGPGTIRELSEAFLRDTVEVASGLASARLYLACSPDRRDIFFQKLEQEYGLSLMDQKGRDLGERMAHVFRQLKKRGFQKILIIGSDLPTLPLAYLRQALTLLDQHEVVIGPSLDGGYYLIGISGSVPPVFDHIPWSTERVFLLTMEKVLDAKLSCGLLPFWYDVDRPEDLRFLKLHLDYLRQKKPEVAGQTRAILELIEHLP
jgi:rSAM/selenodomain-associated transferase 1